MPRFVSVAVPEHLVEDVYAFISERRRPANVRRQSTIDNADGGSPPPHEPSNDSARDASSRAASAEEESGRTAWDAGDLAELYQTANPKLRKMLKYLADHALADLEPAEVPAEEVLGASDITPGRSAGGFLSRARRSAESNFDYAQLPFHQRWDPEAGRYRYWLSKRDAEVIRDSAREAG